MKRHLMIVCSAALLLMNAVVLSADCTSANLWHFSGTSAWTDPADCAKIGIGGPPTHTFHIVGTATSDVFAGMGVDLNTGPAFNFGYSGFSFGRASGFLNVRPDALAVAPNPALRFATKNIVRMMIDRDGVTTINDINGAGPTVQAGDRLVVNGTIRGTNVVATYQDLAEWVPATEEMPAGTVVVVMADAENTVSPSTRAYDTRVAGVVSAQPGIILGVEGASKTKVATTGRVKVRVDAARGAIHPGDLLVSSDKPGVAMRSDPIEINGRRFHQPGTIIGKALGTLESGEGDVLVLLSLQ